MTAAAMTIMALIAAVILVLLALALVLHIASKNSVDRDYDADEIDAQIRRIAEVSEPAPLTMDEAYMRKEVPRVRGLS